MSAFRRNLDGSPTAERPAVPEGSMRVSITAVGRGARVEGGEVTGGTGKLFRGGGPARPGQWDAWFLELQINGMAKVRWTYVPRGSPLLERKPGAR